MRESGRPSWFPAAAASAALALLAFHLIRFSAVADDAYISFRYLDNWLAGQGLVYNAGERVEGYTNLLWIVLLFPLRLTGVAPERASHALSMAAVTLLLWATFRVATRAAGDRLAGWAAVILCSGSVSMARWAGSGMETVGFAALLMWADERLGARQGHTWVSSLLFGAAVLTRPEGALWAAAAFAVVAIRRARGGFRALRELTLPCLVFLILPASQLLFRLAYYGSPLPNTYYAKLTGDLPDLIPLGLTYLWRFLLGGGWALLAGASLLFLARASLDRVARILGLQVLVHALWVVWVGGDSFPFDRFLVPAIAPLAVLGGIGLAKAAGRMRLEPGWVVPAAALTLTIAQAVSAHASPSRRAFDLLETVRAERELVAEWLGRRVPPDSLLAINAAGLIPYRTGLPTVDMLGLNDPTIARVPVAAAATGGETMIGHFKHDGDYVCGRAPEVVVTGGGRLHRGRDAAEAMLQAALNTFPGDREFLRSEACRDRYLPVAEELLPGRFVVVYRRAASETSPRAEPTSARAWFHRGVELMGQARLAEAIAAFRSSLALEPGHPATLTNLGFCLFDLQRYGQAVKAFEEALAGPAPSPDAIFGLAHSLEKLGEKDRAVELWRRYLAEAPDSIWKERAREHLFLLTGSSE